MNALFEFLFKYRPFVYQKGTIAFHPLVPVWAAWLLAAGAVAGAWWLYRRTSGLLARGQLAALIGLRSLTLLLLLFVFLQPVLVLHTVLPQQTFVAIGYDASKSMEIRDGDEGQSRLDVVKQLLRASPNPVLDQLARKFKLRFFRFSGDALKVEGGFQDAPRHGNVTDLERSLSQIVSDLGSAPVSGIVLLTDGADNHSGDLAAAAAQLRARNIAVYPVGIGAPGVSRDLEVVRVSSPKKVLKDAMIEADVAVRSKGYAGRRAKLVVKERDRVIQSQEITLGSDAEVRTHKLSFSSETAGPKIFSFAIEPFSDEVIKENNSSDVLVRVEDAKPQILYAEGEPRWEYGFMRRSVGEDRNLHLVTLLRQADGKYFRQGLEDPGILEKGFPTDKAELFAYKALILGSVEASFFTFDQLRMISDFVSQRGGSFLMLGGKNSLAQGNYVNTPLEDVLPVNLRFASGMPPFQDLEYKLRLTPYGVEHPVTRLSVSEEENRKRWTAVPSLIGLNPVASVKPGATVLAQAASPDARGQNPPVLAFQRFGRGKSMVLATGSTWRWRMGLDHRDNTHELFWKQMLRWLVSDAPDPITIETEKHSSSLDEPVLIRAEVNDPTFVHLNNALVSAEVKAPSGQVTRVVMSWDVRHEGRYSGVFKPAEEGIHEISMTASQGTKDLGGAKANFRVAESTDEYHNAALNTDLLKRLATDTGGRYYSPSEMRALPEDISFVDNGASRIEDKDLWDMPLLFLLLIGSISSEWILRKRKGLA